MSKAGMVKNTCATPLCSLGLLSLAISAIFTTSARADDAAPAQASPVQIQTVTITAERREENIKNVPVSASTLSDEKLDVLTSGGGDLRLLASRVPSLNVESSFGRAFPRFYIRGYGNTDFHLNASQPVSLIYDDVVMENPILKGFPIFDLARVEVLRGPQGSLFGRNTPAGVVKFDSVKPMPGATDGYYSVSDGTYGTRNVEGAKSIPISSDWSARVSMLYQHRDNWVSNTYTKESDSLEGYDDTSGRAQFLYKPSADKSALFSVHARDLVGTARVFRANIIQKGTNDLVSGFDPAQVSLDGKNRQRLQNYGGSARLQWDLDDVTLHSITAYETVHAYSRGDVDGGFGAPYSPSGTYGPGFIPFSSETADAISQHKQITQEFRVESRNKGPLNWQAGMFYFYEDYLINSYSYDSIFSNGAQTEDEKTTQKNTSWALFGSVKYDVSADFNVRGGARFTSDKKTLATDTGSWTPAASSGNVFSANPSSTKFSWDESNLYKLNANTNVYTRIATGYRGATIQPASDFGPLSVAKPETILSYEIGIKTDLFDHRARLGLDIFHYDVKNQQLSAVGGNANVTTLFNAEKSTGQGVELDLDAYLTDNLLATVSASYNDTKIKDSNLAVGVCASCTVLNPTIVNSAGATVALIDGNPLPQAPRWVGNFTLRYGIPYRDGELFAYTDWAYRSDVNFFLYKSTEFTGKPLLEGGLRLGYKWGGDKYEVAVFGRNITNQIRVVGGIDFNNLTGFINDPRTYGVQFRSKL